jgi:hypothetical protein
MPAEAGIQRLKSLDSGQNHAGMTALKRLYKFNFDVVETSVKLRCMAVIAKFAFVFPGSSTRKRESSVLNHQVEMP